MHKTAERLLAAGMANGERNFTSIARRFGGSDQSATNWKTRGVPRAVIIRASAEWHINPRWLSAEDDSPPPDFAKKNGVRPGQLPRNGLAVAEPDATYRGFLTDDERRLLDGFRAADNGVRRSMLLLADDCLTRFQLRIENHR